MEKEIASQSMADPTGTVISHSLQRKFLKLLQSLPETESLQHTY